ncbi:MAG TPA: hypothetical protein VHA30_04185 [Patescibacteria group bacterium]|nr:hypothetical protein [Patescibacteria group bacterium]
MLRGRGESPMPPYGERPEDLQPSAGEQRAERLEQTLADFAVGNKQPTPADRSRLAEAAEMLRGRVESLRRQPEPGRDEAIIENSLRQEQQLRQLLLDLERQRLAALQNSLPRRLTRAAKGLWRRKPGP